MLKGSSSVSNPAAITAAACRSRKASNSSHLPSPMLLLIVAGHSDDPTNHRQRTCMDYQVTRTMCTFFRFAEAAAPPAAAAEVLVAFRVCQHP